MTLKRPIDGCRTIILDRRHRGDHLAADARTATGRRADQSLASARSDREEGCLISPDDHPLDSYPSTKSFLLS